MRPDPPPAPAPIPDPAPRAGTARRQSLRPGAAALTGHAAMLGYAAFVSGSFSLGGLAAPHMDPAALNAVRFALATALMGGIALATARPRRVHFEAPWRYLLLGLPLAVYFVTMFMALRLTDPVSTGTVFTLTPAMSAVFGWLLLRQITTPGMAAALAIGAAGAVWVIFRGDQDALTAFHVGPGEAIFLIGCAGHAIYTPLVPRLRRGEPTIVFTFGVMAAATLIIAAVGTPALLATDFAALPGVVWLAILYLAIFTTAVTFYLLQIAAMRLPAAKVMAYTYLVPSFIVVWEGLLGHGWIEALVLPGIAATTLALLLLLRDQTTPIRRAT